MQRTTGRRGYFGKRESLFDRRHIEKADPRVLRITRWWRQESQSPAPVGIGMSIAPARS